mgnify:CR=1 FL=1
MSTDSHNSFTVISLIRFFQHKGGECVYKQIAGTLDTAVGFCFHI